MQNQSILQLTNHSLLNRFRIINRHQYLIQIESDTDDGLLIEIDLAINDV